jgi:hypothetical protein
MAGFPFNSFGVFRPFPHKRPAVSRAVPLNPKLRRAAMKRGRLVRPALPGRGGLLPRS